MRRWLALLLGATLAALPATAALAATPRIAMDIPARTTIVAGGEAQVSPAFTAGPGYAAHTVGGVVLTAETVGAGLDATQMVARQPYSDWRCVTHGRHKTVCTLARPMGVGHDLRPSGLSLIVRARRAPVGGTGDLKVTFDGERIPQVVERSRVTIARGVIMSPRVLRSSVPSEAAPNTAFDATFGLAPTNAPVNGQVLHGAALVFQLDYAFAPDGQFRNCYYRDGRLTACVFDSDLPDAVAYETVVPLRIRPDTNPGPTPWNVGSVWMTPGDLDDLAANRAAAGRPGLGSRGTGEVLELRALTGKQPGPAQAGPRQSIGQFDDEAYPGFSSIVVGESRRADLAAVGTNVSGAEGATISVPVGVHNNGPVTIDRSKDDKQATAALFTLPPGTGVVTVPSGCMRANDAGTGPYGTQYLCWSPPLVPAGQTYTWEFRLKVTELVPDAKGRIESNPAGCRCDGYPDDTNTSNDAAPVIVNGTAAPAAPVNRDPGGAPPVTGSWTAGVAAGVAAAILAGLVVYVVSRRRRTRVQP
ncbi:hypothetical protein [Krasilnikovia sp. MM14-A1004]|uniref:hypothetical protein n=1 Tax=Krasilnikovia sp. MM14-A1004 TaxID=3373541 RepID=UPI00399D3AC7